LFIKNDRSGTSVEKLCLLLDITRSAYYAWLNRQPSRRELEDQRILRELVRLHQLYPMLGLDSLHQMLKPQFGCSRKRVWRLMKKLNIHSARKRAYKRTTNSNHQNPVAPNLLNRNFQFSKPNEAWVGDITYIPTGEGWLYLAIVKDLCTKKVVGYAYGERINTRLTLDALEMALRRQKPQPGLIFHSDRGVQYASAAYRAALGRHGIRQSMSRKGDPYDNAVAENFFSCLKCECIYLQYFPGRCVAKAAVFRYIEAFYNAIRPHSGIGWLAPNAFEALLATKIEPRAGNIA
jgi:transposase InsO family protein